MLNQFLSRATSYLPHIKARVPLRLEPKLNLVVFIDSELGLPLNFREPEVQKFFHRSIDNYGAIFDIGAHIGTYSILATRSSGVEVHAFEPHPTNVVRLKENIRSNQASNQVKVVQKAAGASDGTVELVIGRGDSAHSIVDLYDNQESLTVDCTTLDAYCVEETYPDFVKVDVEGAGGELMAGASELLSRQPDWLVEVHSEVEEHAFKDSFLSNGYEIINLTSDHWFVTAEGNDGGI